MEPTDMDRLEAIRKEIAVLADSRLSELNIVAERQSARFAALEARALAAEALAEARLKQTLTQVEIHNRNTKEWRVALDSAEALAERLRVAGQAVCDRWDSPQWKDRPHTGVFIQALRDACVEAARIEAGE